MQPLPPQVAPGAVVAVRAGRWMLDAAVLHEDCRELHLSELGQARRAVLLWPFDRPTLVRAERHLIVVRPRKWWRRIAPMLARARDPLTPRAHDATADVLTYQLAPAVAAASGAGGLLLADEVGLGKTVQAGWIVADRIARNPDSRTLVAVPAGLRHQWASELTRHFAIEANIATAQWLRRTTASLPADVSPWAAPGVYVASIDFVKRPDLTRSLGQIDWDLLVVDEAHLAASPTDRFSALQRIARAARQVVLITATPYSGDPAAFNSMLSLAAVDGAGQPVMFRRSREDAGDSRRRRHRFALVGLTPEEHRLQRLLERYSREVWRDAPGDREQARLAVTILRKRALSSPAAALRSLVRRGELLRGTALPRQLALFDADGETEVEDDVSDAALAAPGLADTAREQRMLRVLIDAARRAATDDSKRRRLMAVLRRLNGESAIVFTEYRDTLVSLAAGIPRSLQLHGGLGAVDRAAVQARFNREGGVLLATDAACHGLNLQERCRIVISYELPWNPARLEQRIGRVDRIGQHRPVHAVTLVARDTAEDLVLANLAKRLVRVARRLGDRDRLASFLTDARAAGLVIGGDALPADDADPHGSFAPASRYERQACAAAASLRNGRRTNVDRSSREDDVFVTSVRASADIRPGAVFAVRCRAAGADGDTAAEKVVLLHVRGTHSRPGRASLLRRRTGSILHAVESDMCTAAAALVEDWYHAALEAHTDSIDRRIQRESALLRSNVRSSEMQPGLFDRRAVRQAETAALNLQRTAETYEDRLRSLERSRELRLTCTICAVLVAWR